MSEDKVKLTKTWIAMRLYEGPKSLNDFITDGCLVMVYGWEYEEFVKIINDMVGDMISGNSQQYTLTAKGLFEVKKHAIVPLLKLTNDQHSLQEFMTVNEKNCDLNFLSQLSSEIVQSKKEHRIIVYAKDNLESIMKIIKLITEYFSTPS